MQTGYRAQGNLGYYSAQLFDLTPFESIRGDILELGRACVHDDYRNTTALFLLWKGIASYATLCHARYLIGCSSLTSQDQNEGMSLYYALKDRYLIEAALRTEPSSRVALRQNFRRGSHAAHAAASSAPTSTSPVASAGRQPSILTSAFIDFLTLVDLHRIPDRVRTRFF